MRPSGPKAGKAVPPLGLQGLGTQDMVAPPSDCRSKVSDVFQEVDEELRRDKAAELWKRYGNYVVGAAVALVVATAGYVAWRDYNHRQAVAHSTAFFDASLAGDPAKAIPALDTLARETSGGYAALARLREAALLASSGKRDEAAATYRSVAEDGAAPAELRDLARLLASLQSVEKTSAADLEKQLETLRGSSSPWRYSAYELIGLAALRGGDAAKARELFAKISDDPAAPTAMRGRAAEMIAALGT
jgi:hypothetical protein